MSMEQPVIGIIEMKSASLRKWYAVHRWSSLVCTFNLLLLCLSGFVLIFHEEIEEWSERGGLAVTVTPEAARPTLQQLVDRALAAHPGSVAKSISFFDDKERLIGIRVGPPGVTGARGGKSEFYKSATGEVHVTRNDDSLMGFIQKLHVNLFLALPGQLFIGAIGLLFGISMVSGIVLYAPFTRKIAFGVVRFGRHPRIVLADLHNLSGMVVMVWALLVGLTGTFLACSPLIIGLWQKTELAELAHTLPVVAPKKVISPNEALRLAVTAIPGKDPAFIFYPGSEYATQRHYMVVQRGHSTFEKRVYSIVVVDAEAGTVSQTRGMPWYIQILLFSAPLHFGDFGGLPLKIFWAFMNVLLLAATATGFLIWAMRSKAALHQLEVKN